MGEEIVRHRNSDLLECGVDEYADIPKPTAPETQKNEVPEDAEDKKEDVKNKDKNKK